MPRAVNAAYEAIWNTLVLDPVAAGGTTYYQTCASSGIGGATMSKVGSFYRTAQVAGTGTSSVLKHIATVPKTFSGTGTPTLNKGLLYTVLVQVVATGSVTTLASLVLGSLLQVTGTGTATVSKMIGKTLSSVGTGTSSLVRQIGKVLTTTAIGAPTLTDVYSGFKSFSIGATGTISSFTASFIPGGISAAAIRFRRALLGYIRRR